MGSSRTAADICVAILRTEAGRDPHDRALHDLVGELSTRSDEFRTRWASHNVRLHGTGTKRFHHPVVGELVLAYEGLENPHPGRLTHHTDRDSPERGCRPAPSARPHTRSAGGFSCQSASSHPTQSVICAPAHRSGLQCRAPSRLLL